MRGMPAYRKKRVEGRPHDYAICRINGKVHHLGIYGTEASRQQYDRLIKQYLSTGRSRSFGHESLTLGDLIAQYGQWAKGWYVRKDGTPTGVHANMKPLMRRLLEWYGQTDAECFTPLMFRDVIERLIDEGLNVKTVNDAIARVKHMYRWAVSRQLVPVEVKQALECVTGESEYRTRAKPRKSIRGVDDVTLERTIRELSPTVAAMVRLQRVTGMRPGEVVLIRPDCIEQAGESWWYTPERHKTEHIGKQRVIVLNRVAQAILAPYMTTDGYCFQPESRGKVGAHYTSASYRRAVHRACERLKIPKWAPNQIRHKVGEEIQSRTGDLKPVMAVLGHSREETAKRYAKQNFALAEQVMRNFS